MIFHNQIAAGVLLISRLTKRAAQKKPQRGNEEQGRKKLYPIELPRVWSARGDKVLTY